MTEELLSLPHSLPCLDIRAGIRQLEGNTKLYISLLQKFAECNRDLMARMEGNLEENNWNAARRLAHSTKGVAGSIGATELYMASAALEAAVTQGDYRPALQDFSRTVETVLHSIAALLHDQHQEDLPRSLEGKLDSDVLCSLLEELDHDLRAGDFKALQSYAALQRYVTDTALEEEVNELEPYVHLLEYRQVAEKLALIRLRLRNRQL
ncbi:MAG: Hpt domain-containing protein [Candidatus Electrothrix sp. YB6]